MVEAVENEVVEDHDDGKAGLEVEENRSRRGETEVQKEAVDL